MTIIRNALATIGAGVVAGSVIQGIHGKRVMPVKVEDFTIRPHLFQIESPPSDVWAPEIIGDVIKGMVDDIQRQADAEGVQPDWSDVSLRTEESNDRTYVRLSVGVVT